MTTRHNVTVLNKNSLYFLCALAAFVNAVIGDSRCLLSNVDSKEGRMLTHERDV